MTTFGDASETRAPRASKLLAEEIRVELARQGRSARQLAFSMNRTQSWLSLRISPKAKVDMTVDEVVEVAEALDVPVERLFRSVLPRLDSNQQPSGYVYALVRGARTVVERLAEWRLRRRLGPLAVVVDLDAARAARALERVA